MTQEEKMRITDLRNEGVGYNRISEMLGISENTVKSFCRRNGLTGDRGSRHPKEPVCHYCGAPVKQTPGRKEKKFCSDSCRMKWWAAHRDRINHKAVHEHVCPVCGTTFTVYGNAPRKYCSHECYIVDRFGGDGRG